jgi:2-hydroxy-3-keto-5-methylthiopentenyl-1-phosphate phosphatase
VTPSSPSPEPASEPSRGVLVSDWDGTITRYDFFDLVYPTLVNPGLPDYWGEYVAGRLTHFGALAGIFGHIICDEATLLATARRTAPDPRLATEAARLRAAGWEVVIASAGCGWYIERLLWEAGAERLVTLHANPGRFEAGKGLLMSRPKGSPFESADLGVDKAAVVRDAIARVGKNHVAFAGDGRPDLPAAKLVDPSLRFARGRLAELLAREALPFRPFEAWSEVPEALLGK